MDVKKHIVAALLVAPALALIAYFAVDRMVDSEPGPAQQGRSYRLTALPKCRYSSGECTLKNGNFSVTLTPEPREGRALAIVLRSVFPLSGARLAIVDEPGQKRVPWPMQSLSDDGRRWEVVLARPVPETAELRLVVAANEALYYGTTGGAFLSYETSYGQDFRAQSD